MATEPDPYRTLGLTSTASLAEVKAAYRRLAKVNHPDAAGEAALPRFLAIQAAYERLAGPAPRRGEARGAAASSPNKPWEADPDRRDATYRAYGGRSRRPAGEPGTRAGRGPKPNGASGGPAGPGGPAGAGGSARSSSAPSGSAGQSSTGQGSARASSAGSPGSSSDTAGSGRTGRPKKATLGSTSYDGVDRETFEPDWGGASWYGTTSGTYWTINPKEYADPRKHGPEYLARARRGTRPEGSDDDPGARAAGFGPADDDPATDGDAAAGAEPASEAPRHTTTSWWESTSGAAAAAREAAPEPPPPPRAAPRPRPNPGAEASRSSPGPASGPSSPARSTLRRGLVDGVPPSVGWRIARAVIAWAPIGLAIGWASGEFTGCGRFAATCDPGTAPVVWVVQAFVLLLLLALPSIAGWAVVAAGVCLVVAIPTTLFVTASAGAAASETGTAFLGSVLVIAWLAGLAAAVYAGRAAARGPTGPVS